MDPFSLAVGIAGLAGLAATTLSMAIAYKSGVKNVKSSVLTLITELEALQSNLCSLDSFLRNLDSKALAFQNTSVLRSCASSCEIKLRALSTKLGQMNNSKTSRYLWPLSEKEHLKTVQELRAFAQWIHFALSVDGCALLSQTSNDVLNVLEQQVVSFRALKEIENETIQLQDAVRDQTRMLRDDRDSRKKEQILGWISRLDPDQKHHAVRSPRVEDTGGWLLREPKYLQWRDDFTTSNVLWCRGDPGSGKSVLASTVIDELKAISSPYLVTFLYFDYRDRDNQTSLDMLSSILRQVVAAMHEVPKSVTETYDRFHDSGGSVSTHEIEKLLLEVIGSLSGLYLIVDALDECDESRHRTAFLNFISQLQQITTARIFVTSRPHLQDIKANFNRYPQVDVRAHDSDLRSYMRQELSQNGVDEIVDDELANKIMETVLNNAQGMFLLPILQLRTVLKEPTAGEMEDTLASLSNTLGEAFEQTIGRIQGLPESRRRLGTNALMWICHARRPMTVAELRDALSIRLTQGTMSPKHRPMSNIIVECCQGLIVVDPETTIIRLAHLAIQEYLMTHGNMLSVDNEANLAAACLTYLLFDPFRQGPLHLEEEIGFRIASHPFLAYASRYCGIHARLSEKNEIIQRLLISFLSCRSAVANATQVSQFIKGLREEYWDFEECNSVNALQVACRFGLETTVQKLISLKAFPIDEGTKMGTTPLITAAAGGHVSIVRLLLRHGASPYMENWFGNALYCAAEAGHSGAIVELVRFGMSPNSHDGHSHGPLECALHNDHADAFETLVNLGAEIDPPRLWNLYPSAFHLAVQNGCINVVDLILRKRWMDVNSKAYGGLTALHFAARNSGTEVLIRLLEAGADIDAKDDLGRTALDYAMSNEHSKSQKLLDRSALIIAADEMKGSAVVASIGTLFMKRNEQIDILEAEQNSS